MRPMIILSVLVLASLACNVYQYSYREAFALTHQGGSASLLRTSTGHVTISHMRKPLAELPETIPTYTAYPESPVIPDKASPMSGFLVPPPSREDFGRMLESLGGFKVGVELGVQRGNFARHMLNTWPSAEKYYLVDLWAQQENYVDGANVDNRAQEEIMQRAQANLKQYKHTTVFIKDFTSKAAAQIPDLVDFVYVDARHDYCGAMEDMETYWPKIRPGGIMAGHDYASAHQVHVVTRGVDKYSICINGTINHGAVRGAVDDFARKRGLQVSVTWGEPYIWKSWLIRKRPDWTRERDLA
eukprot:gene371-1759_t